MKKILLTIPLFILALGLFAQTNPTPFDLSSGSYSFNNWAAGSTAETYPNNMMFHVFAAADPILATEPNGDWMCVYNIASRARVSGLDADGVGFINTGDIQDTEARCQNGPTNTGGYVGAAVVALNATGREDITLNFTLGIVSIGSGTPTPRECAIRLQYRIGTGGVWTDVPGPVEYSSAGKNAGESQNFSNVILPSSCNDQPVVQVRWKYYFVAANDGGSRPMLRVDDISITSSVLTATPDPEISATPTTLADFVQFVGTPSDEKTISVSGFNLTENIAITAPANFEISQTTGTGFTNSITLTQASGSVTATTIYIRMNKATIGNASGNLSFTSQNATTVNIALNGEAIDVDPDLLYYWHFNNLNTSGGDVKEINADYKLISASDPKMTYTGTNTNGRDMDEFDPGSDLNLQLGEIAGKGARVRNISDNRSLEFNMPTTGHSQLKFEYAIFRSGSGMLKNIIEYSIDGTTFTSTGLNQNEFEITETYAMVEVDFAGITAVNDNANFKIRITFEGNTTADNGNNRYDNITLKKNQPLSYNTLSVKENALIAYPNPVSTDVVYFNKTISFEVYDIFGKMLDIKENTNNLNVTDLPVGMYFVKTTKGETLKIVRN
jgi:hypothetical protein